MVDWVDLVSDTPSHLNALFLLSDLVSLSRLIEPPGFDAGVLGIGLRFVAKLS